MYMFAVCVMMKEFLGTKWLHECSLCDAAGTNKYGFHIGVTKATMWYIDFSHRPKLVPEVKYTFVFNKLKLKVIFHIGDN
jgi:hypothetical protein